MSNAMPTVADRPNPARKPLAESIRSAPRYDGGPVRLDTRTGLRPGKQIGLPMKGTVTPRPYVPSATTPSVMPGPSPTPMVDLGGTATHKPDAMQDIWGKSSGKKPDSPLPGYAKGTKPKLGSGERFAALKGKLSKRKGVRNPGALAAAIGRNKYGKERFQELAAKGK